MKNSLLPLAIVATLLFFSSPVLAGTYYVKNIKAEYRNGQTFITWKCPSGKNFQYNVYRATYKIGSKSKLGSQTFIGYVRDSSSKNIRKTQKTGVKHNFIIKEGDDPLANNIGLYVVTCDYNASYFYAVTVTDLTTGTEGKTITLDENSLSTKVVETIADPQPVLQGTEVLTTTGETAYDYVQFGGNQDLPNYPSFFNQGSYGFNFFIVYRGAYTNGPLYLFYEGLEGNSLVGNGLGSFDTITNCTIISLDDWLPYPNGYGETDGLNTFWSGYSEDFNPYVLNSPIPHSGVIRMYQQHRYIHTIDWANKYMPIDSNRIYLVGVSAGGFGALLTAMIVPKKIAAVYTIVAPVVIKSSSLNGSDTTDEQMWGYASDNLPSDVNDPNTGLPLAVTDLMNIKTMLQINANIGLPPIYSIHGKNDMTVYWSDKPQYLNLNETSDQGGIHFWDQREHDGTNANFTDGETTPQFNHFAKNISYPAFANCSSNQNPGNGDPNDGDGYGSYSGNIQWDTLVDGSCKWTCHMMKGTLTVGGEVLGDGQTYCYADVTVRRPQAFLPESGVTLKWKNYDKDNDQIASGSFTYNGGPITIPGVKIKKSGNRLEISIKGCHDDDKMADNSSSSDNQLVISNTYSGWILNITAPTTQAAFIEVYDVVGRKLYSEQVELAEGPNAFPIPMSHHGSYIIRVNGTDIHEASKAVF